MNELARKVFREGLAPQLPTQGLLALKQALEEDDPALLQGATVSPPWIFGYTDRSVDGACPISFSGWRAGLKTVKEVTDFFTEVYYGTKKQQIAGCCNDFIHWVDETPRNQMRQELLVEVTLELSTRTQRPKLLASA